MDRKLADGLVEKLGISLEIAGKLNDDESYQRFEWIINYFLKKYDGKTKAFAVKDKKGKLYSVRDFSEALEIFRRCYGLGFPISTKAQVARELDPENEEASSSKVDKMTKYIIDVLSQRHRAEIISLVS